MTSPSIPAADSPLEQQTMRTVSWRILPLMFAAYCMAYIDRVNVGFAAVPMRAALQISAAQYGLAAGLFFVGYFIFEIPSNLVLARVGARKWIARIMVSWAVVSALNAFVVGTDSFYLVRFMLGVAEAGFFPGLLFFITLWYPQRYHSRIYAVLIASTPLSIIIGSLVSLPLLKLDGVAGLAGWQWLFVIQAIPTVLLGIAVLATLPDGPQAAQWLSAAQKAWLAARLSAERAQKDSVPPLRRRRRAQERPGLDDRAGRTRHQLRRLRADPVPADHHQRPRRQPGHGACHQRHPVRGGGHRHDPLGAALRQHRRAALACRDPVLHLRRGADLDHRLHRADLPHVRGHARRHRRVLLRLGAVGAAARHAQRGGRGGRHRAHQLRGPTSPASSVPT